MAGKPKGRKKIDFIENNGVKYLSLAEVSKISGLKSAELRKYLQSNEVRIAIKKSQVFIHEEDSKKIKKPEELIITNSIEYFKNIFVNFTRYGLS